MSLDILAEPTKARPECQAAAGSMMLCLILGPTGCRLQPVLTIVRGDYQRLLGIHCITAHHLTTCNRDMLLSEQAQREGKEARDRITVHVLGSAQIWLLNCEKKVSIIASI
jgi:hypothetical protein